jgi:hypothetical protein
MCRGKVWHVLTGDDTCDPDDWLRRLEDTPRTLYHARSAEQDMDTAHELVREEGQG